MTYLKGEVAVVHNWAEIDFTKFTYITCFIKIVKI